ncbi:MAG: NADPH:quinone oxidoreductase family protein [Myxococcota bacterium]
MSTMRAVEIPSSGGPRVARIIEVPVPQPKAGEVLVRIAAGGLNFADVMQTRGLYVGGPKPPYIAGFEGAGEVVQVGEGVDLAVGAKVIGTGPGAFAEYAAWRAKELIPLPPRMSFAQGAAFFVQWLTAHGCLRTFGRLVPGETVLIHAGAGGVGSAAIRLAKHFGAQVIATASSDDKLAKMRELGADVVINYQTQDFVEITKQHTQGRGAHLILEMVGGEIFDKNWKALMPFGRMVVYGAASTKAANARNIDLIFKPIEVIGYHLTVLMTKRPDLFQAEMVEVESLLAAGVILPEEPKQYRLADAVQALTDLEERRTTGKLVLVP